MAGLPQVPVSDLTQSNLLELLLKQQQQSMAGLPKVPVSDLTQSNLLELLLKQQQQSMAGLPQVPASDLTQSNLLELLLKQQQLRLMMHNTLLQSLTQLLTSEQTELLRHTLTTDSLVPNEMANTPISPKSQSSSVLSPHSLGAFFDISNWLSAIHPLGRTTRSSDNVAGGFEVFFAFFPVSRFWILNHVLI
jgi:hypothetical protein